jgi:adenylate cyclase
MARKEVFKRRLAAIVFADIAGWSRLIEKNDAETLRAWKALRSDLIEPKIHEHDGRLLEVAGDAVVIEFPSAVAAVSWAIDLQTRLVADKEAGTSTLAMRIGVNVEDVIVDGDKLVGDGVNIAARIHQIAAPGEIVVTKSVRDYVHNKLAVALTDLGERQLKNIDRDIRIYRVELRPAAPLLAASEPRTLLAVEPGNGDPGIKRFADDDALPFKPLSVDGGASGRVVLEFASPQHAIQSAFAIQKRGKLRMGMDVGAGATQLSALAEPNELYVTAAVRDRLTDGLDAMIEDLGERTPRGSNQPLRAFRAQALAVTRPAERSRPAGERPSIAVLPFRNLSADPAQSYLGELIADDVIGDLSRLIDLSVISRLSTSPFRDRPYEPRQVAEALGVRYVLSGSLHTSGKRLRLMAELTEAGAAHVIWAERFEGSIAEIFELQDQLSQAISRRVVPYVRQLEMQRARSAQPENLTAYERTLRAIDHFHCSSQQDLEQARMLLEAAIEADPTYVSPHAWLAHWYVRCVGQGWSTDVSRDTMQANRYSEAALRCDATDPQALAVSGLVASYLNKDLETAVNQHNRALTINPSASAAWLWSTSAYAWLGNGGEAVRRSQRAIELSPFDPQMYMFTSIAGTAHAVDGQYDKAIEWCRRSLRQNRMFASTHRILVISLALSGRAEDARVAGADLLKVEPSLTVARFLKRYPGSDSPHAKVFGEALASAGVPP